jgi:putative hydrolase of the HAD superfamily
VHERFEGAGGSVEGSLAWVARRLGAAPSPAQLADAARLRMASERRFGEPRADAVAVLTALRERGLQIGLISDCSAELPQYFAGLPIAPLIDVAVFSFVLGHRKPAPETYLACCAGLGVEPAECLYVGDGGSNELPGARAIGLRAVHLAVADERDGVVYGRHDDWDGEVVTSLAGVLDLL